MAKPYIHAQSSARRFGGKPEDYIEIHNLMDSSKAAFADNRHRALTHNAWFIGNILERIKFANSEPAGPDNRFVNIKNSEGKLVSVRDIGEQHILEDFKNRFIPTAQDYLQELEFKDWMQNGNGEAPPNATPPSFAKIGQRQKQKVKEALTPTVLPEDLIADGARPTFDGTAAPPKFTFPGHLID
jgi:hypothetical protein